MGGTEVECTFDSQAGIRYGVEDHVIEDVVVVEKGAEEEIEDEVVTEIEVGFYVAHVVQSFYEIHQIK